MQHIKTKLLNLKSILTGLMLLASFATIAQYNGITSVYPNQYKTYTYTRTSGQFVSPVWTVNKGTVEDSFVSSDRLTATVNVIWTTTGAGSVSVTDGGFAPGTYNVTINTCPTFGAPTAPTVPASCVGNTVTLTSVAGSNGKTVFWFATATSNPALYQGATYTTPALSGATTFYIATGIAGSSCVGSRTAVNITPNPNQAPSPTVNISSGFVYISGSTTLVVNEYPGTTARWYAADTGGTYIAQGPTYTTPSLTTTTDYYTTLYNATTGCESTPRVGVRARVLPYVAPMKIKTEAIRVEGKTQDNQLYTLTEAEKTTVFTHFDGLARPDQSILLKASPSGKDMLQITSYNELGQAKSFLPFTAPTNATGAYHVNALTEQAAFYNTPTDDVADDVKPFAEAVFESSPLGRVLKSGGFGDAFQSSGTHATTNNYSYNTGSTNSEAEEVRQFNSDGTSSVFFAANNLARTEVTDADGNKQIVYTDARGRVLARKRQLDEVVSNTNSTVVTYQQTYYVYDEFDRVKYIISPKGVATLRGNGWNLTPNILKAYVYQFVYDKRGRLVEKKVPGQAWMYYGYDRLNRLVLAQDSLLRGANKWIFVKYDKKGRTVMQGLYTNTTHTTRSAIQTNVLDPLYASPANVYYETRGTTQEGYTNLSFPTTGTEVWSVSYFDSYDVDNIPGDEASYTAQSLANELPAVTPYNMPTASKRIIFGTTTWLYSYVFYDKYGRAIQVKSNNHMRTIPIDNVQTSVFDYEGKLLTSKTYHHTGTPVTTILKYNYDTPTQTRLTAIEESINGSAYQEVVNYTYNELGQLVDKKLHKTSAGSYLQSVDYRYTIRGQLKSINNAQLTAQINDDKPDYFGMELLYNDTESALANTAQYNGNASAIKWKALGMGSNASGQRSYTLAYDKTGQLKTAAYKAHNGTNWSAEAAAQNETMAYDLNGNIRKLLRNQRKHQLAGVIASYISENIDDLTYTYSGTFGDRLLKVEEAATANPLAGFNNGTTGSNTDFAYDNNGNLTADQNKGIASITYNFLGKPQVVTFSGSPTKTITYTYDAAGTKLRMVTLVNSVTTTTDYVNGFVYENAALSFFGSPEGRVVKNGANFEYQYAIADHQGNTRVVFTSATPATQSVTATFETSAQTTEATQFNNYPSAAGINPVNTNNATPGGTRSQYLNAGYMGMVGVAKSYKVYPGDKVKLEAYARYNAPSGTNGSLTSFASVLLTAFGLPTPAGGETGTPASAINAWGTVAAGGFGNSTPANGLPKAFINIILFDKDYNRVDFAYAQVTSSGAPALIEQEYTVKEAGYAYLFISNEHPTQCDVYFDEVKMSYTPSNIVQYNEYYPFGMQTSSSWTRDNNKNNFKYNEASELNTTSGWYDLAYRNYDASLGRFMQVDPMAYAEHGMSPYQYASNNPVFYNDPTGLYKAPFWAGINYLLNHTKYGGTYSNGEATPFSSQTEAFYAAAAHAEKWGLWGSGGGGGGGGSSSFASSFEAAAKTYSDATGEALPLREVEVIETRTNTNWFQTRIDDGLSSQEQLTQELVDRLFAESFINDLVFGENTALRRSKVGERTGLNPETRQGVISTLVGTTDQLLSEKGGNRVLRIVGIDIFQNDSALRGTPNPRYEVPGTLETIFTSPDLDPFKPIFVNPGRPDNRSFGIINVDGTQFRVIYSFQETTIY